MTWLWRNPFGKNRWFVWRIFIFELAVETRSFIDVADGHFTLSYKVNKRHLVILQNCNVRCFMDSHKD